MPIFPACLGSDVRKALLANENAGWPLHCFTCPICVQDSAVKKDLNTLQVASASSLMAGALQAALIQTLIRKNLISGQEGREIYEQALLLLETSQTKSSSQDVFEAAREMIEAHLRGHGARRPTGGRSH